MSGPTVGRRASSLSPQRGRLRRMPLILRRCGAWALEVSLLVASGWIPYELGRQAMVQSGAGSAPLLAPVAQADQAIAQTLALPRHDRPQVVPPATNLLWSAALVMPAAIATWQLWRLAKTGQTLPKSWLNVRVVNRLSEPPGLGRALIREGISRWSLPLGLAYFLWRYSWAFPSLGWLTGLAAIAVLSESFSARFHRQRRALHDRLAGTYVVNGAGLAGGSAPTPAARSTDEEWRNAEVWDPEGAIVASVVFSPEQPPEASGLWWWMRRHPGLTLLLVALSASAAVLGTFVGTQVYIQGQANWRADRQRYDEKFLQLVNQATTPTSLEAQRGAILALGTLDNPDAVQVLADLLSQEEEPVLIEAIQQALVSTGGRSLPYLRRLNQSTQNDLAALNRADGDRVRAIALRQQATQRAIAKLLTLESGQLREGDLSRVNLAESGTPAPFTLVLNQIDLAGLSFQNAKLAGAEFRGSRFYGLGGDGRAGTFDDAIAVFNGAELKEVDFSGADLRYGQLQRTNLLRALLTKAQLGDASLAHANLSSAQLIGADLQRADLTSASLTGAALGSANLSQATLREANLGAAIAVAAQLTEADLVQSDWRAANLSQAMLQRANLRQSDLSRSNLSQADLRDAQLQDASFRFANLAGVDLRGANLQGADFAGATFFQARSLSSSEFIQRPTAESAPGLQGVNFTQARNLSEDQLAYLCPQGIRHPACE